MTLEEVNKQSVIIDGVTYTPKTKCVRLKNGEADYTIIKSAQEVYLEIKNKIDICEPTDRERMDQLEGMVGMLAEQVARQSLGM